MADLDARKSIWFISIVVVAVASFVVSFLFWDILNRATYDTESLKENLSENLQDLEIEKLKLEILKLQREIDPPLTRLLFESPLITLIVAVTGGLIALINVTRGLSLQREQHKEERIAGFLDKLGSEKEWVRLGAAQALARYQKETIAFLINQLRMDSSKKVRMGVAQALSQASSRNFYFLRDSNLSAQSERRNIVAGLFAIGVSTDSVASIVKLDIDEVQSITQLPEFQQDIENWKINESIDSLSPGEKKQLKQRLISQTSQLHIFISELAQTIARALRNCARRGERIPANLTEMDLRLTNLSDITFKRVNLLGSNLRSSVLKRCNFYKVTFIRSCLESANFNRSTFGRVTFRKCIMTRAICSDITLCDTMFKECDLDQVNFSRSSLHSTIFAGCKGSRPRFNGSKLDKAQFQNTKFFEAEFMGSSLHESDLTGATMWRSKFVEAKLSKAHLREAKLGGADLSRANMENVIVGGANFRNANLQETNLKGANFKGADLAGAKLWSISAFDKGTNFESANWWEADFREEDVQSPFYRFLADNFPRHKKRKQGERFPK